MVRDEGEVMAVATAAWARTEFGRAQLGDSRRTERLMQVATARAEAPAASLPAGFADKASLKGMYRFVENPHVEREQILASHYQATAERCAAEPVVLVVQDTTVVDFTHHPATQGLGVLNDPHHQGLLLHSTLAFTPTGLPLGLLDQQVLLRAPERLGQRHQRRQRPFTDKESSKWLPGLERAAALAQAQPAVRVVTVADREADVYDVLLRAQQLAQPVLVRAAWDRALVHPQQYLWAAAESWAVAAHQPLALPRQGRRAARQAEVSVRYGRVTLKPPRYRRHLRLPSLTVDLVLVREEAPPAQTAPLEWLLITTAAVESREQALERLGWYRQRWSIEVYHRVLKSGCRIEARQFESAAVLGRYLAIDAVTAWRVLVLTRQGREQPELPCALALDPPQWQALSCYMQRTPTPPTTPPSLGQALEWIAQLGGYLGRQSGGPPGTTAIWRGMQQLARITDAWLRFTSPPEQPQCG